MPLIISYEPPSSPLDHRGPEKFHREYVSPLGRGRKNVKVSSSEITIESNRPGLLNLAANLLDLALTRQIDLFRLEPVEELNPPGGWYGDLEPNSPALLLERVGSSLHSPSGFHYEAPPFRNHYQPAMENGSIIELKVGRYESRQEAAVRGTASALLSLAKHSIYLSQALEEAKLVYGNTEGVKGDRKGFVLKGTVFTEDVPWARIPSSRNTEES